MPKRRNPFGDCSPLQFKQHVGIKEVDMGIAHDQNMKSVFERTKELLFSGARKSLEMQTDANCNNIYTEEMLQRHSEVAMEDEGTPHCQMQISNTGQLISHRDGNAKPRNAFEALMKGKSVSGKANSGCQCCKGQAASQNRCGFCEKSICRDCVRMCSSCDGHFCQLCSVMNPEEAFQQWYCQSCSYSYDDITERSFCLNCAS